MIDKTKLQDRIEQLTEESGELQRQITSHRQRITEIDPAHQAAQQRYDLQGDDSASEEMAALRSERQSLDRQIADLTQQAAEYPSRITAIRNEIALIDHRDNLRKLATDRQGLVAAFNEYEQSLHACIELYHDFVRLHQPAQHLSNVCENYARANGLPTPPRVVGVTIVPERSWFDMRAGGTVEQYMSQARRYLEG